MYNVYKAMDDRPRYWSKMGDRAAVNGRGKTKRSEVGNVTS